VSPDCRQRTMEPCLSIATATLIGVMALSGCCLAAVACPAPAPRVSSAECRSRPVDLLKLLRGGSSSAAHRAVCGTGRHRRCSWARRGW